MQLKNEQYEEIKQVVIDTYREYDVRCIPISAFELAVKMGLKMIAYSTLSEEKREAARKISTLLKNLMEYGKFIITMREIITNE